MGCMVAIWCGLSHRGRLLTLLHLNRQSKVSNRTVELITRGSCRCGGHCGSRHLSLRFLLISIAHSLRIRTGNVAAGIVRRIIEAIVGSSRIWRL